MKRMVLIVPLLAMIIGCATQDDTKTRKSNQQSSATKPQTETKATPVEPERERVSTEQLQFERQKINEERIAKLKGYNSGIGTLTESKFFEDGWNGSDTFRGQAGVLCFQKENGVNAYTLGYYASSVSEPLVLKDIAGAFEMMMKKPNASYDIRLKGSSRTVICDLVFSNGLLSEMRWHIEEGADGASP